MEAAQARRLGEEIARVDETADRLREQAADPSASDDDVIDAAEQYMVAVGARNAAYDRARGEQYMVAVGARNAAYDRARGEADPYEASSEAEEYRKIAEEAERRTEAQPPEGDPGDASDGNAPPAGDGEAGEGQPGQEGPAAGEGDGS